ncbi:uncharacterized protein LOC127246485 [Andrographis paniculata]|uniref:uncharacterized protein LOC127246485 n=1 Tax=Andrographis paniculata TaxID=175694 RepID=UPI0021E8928C|nr:uncharacterized protein LOC127246485 [Andrographis paniculata]
MDDSEHNKLFVGGISWETTDVVLKRHFEQYGTVLAAAIAKDRNTGNPRGFAFVTFSETASVNRALQEAHQILGRTVEVKRAIPRSEQQIQQQQQQHRGLDRSNSRANGRINEESKEKKIFVGGLPANLTLEEFRSYFEKFGKITDVAVIHDNNTRRPRGFGFITFDSEDSVEEVLQKKYYELTGKNVEVKRAIPKEGIINNIDGYNGGFSDRRKTNFNSYQQESYSPFNTRFGYFPSGFSNVAGYPYGAPLIGNGYPSGGYGGIGYGFAPVSQGSPWSPAMFGVGGGFLPYGNVAPAYPTYLNSGPGVVSFATNGYNGILSNGFSGTSVQTGVENMQISAEPTRFHAAATNVDANSFGSGRSTGAAAS